MYKLFQSLFICAIVSATCSIPVKAKNNPIKELTEICMLSEEIFQEYILLGLGIEPQQSAAQIKANITAVDSKLAGFQKIVEKNPQIVNKTQLIPHWKAIKLKASQPPQYSQANELKLLVNQFIEECLAIDFQLINENDSRASESYIKLSELEILSRQMASLYLLKAWGPKSHGSTKEFHDIAKKFSKELHALLSMQEEIVPEEVKTILRQVKSEFMVFKIFSNSNSGRYIPSLAKVKSDRIKSHLELALKREESELK
ncbi:hypothetical protein [Aliikangiella coralliicola]|uniref:Uncharacterized protein n=1 Tax=Aliikangiella coralliicola TaxID=2592383 RepID=A0A545UJC2_9GAMM|nr:hypothetical protein [Aliikangiella coralliicola]TQV89559.1 hypothetical protein FLL46_01355 [Aliikangiella coralliicola]